MEMVPYDFAEFVTQMFLWPADENDLSALLMVMSIFRMMRTCAFVLPMIPETWEDVPWCVSLTFLLQRAQGEKRGVVCALFPSRG